MASEDRIAARGHDKLEAARRRRAEQAAASPLLPLGWDESHVEAYRDGYTDALQWALEHEHHEIETVLDDSEAR